MGLYVGESSNQKRRGRMEQQQQLGGSKDSQSGSRDGTLLNYTTGGDSIDDCEDERSENNCWKGHLYTSSKDNYV
ncbi:hypothetical protein Tco_1158085 [Tanacetum coccineum]